MGLINQADNIVTIYDASGKRINEVILPEKIVTIPTKRGGFGESGLYYKGSGCIYRNHMVNFLSPNCKLLGKTGLLYEKYQVVNSKLVGMKGIFTFPHQPIFSDYEGGCGLKERKVLDNIKTFELTSIEEVVDVIPTGLENQEIYVYRYRNVSGGIAHLAELIEYVLANDFNTAWDKNLISDIEGYKYVRDLADWFVSNKVNHKFGTVFAFLYSIYNNEIYNYVRLLNFALGTNSADRRLIVYYSALITDKFCPGIFEKEGIEVKKLTKEVYKQLLELLFGGKACCHLEDDDKWGHIREELKQTIAGTVEKCWEGINEGIKN